MNYELKMSERRAKMKAEKSRRDNTLLSVCFSLRYGVALKKSRRDDISVEGNSTFSIPKSRRDDMSVERWNNLLILTCHPYGILLTANIFSTDISSLRDFLSTTTEINAGIACSKKLSEP